MTIEIEMMRYSKIIPCMLCGVAKGTRISEEGIGARRRLYTSHSNQGVAWCKIGLPRKQHNHKINISNMQNTISKSHKNKTCSRLHSVKVLLSNSHILLEHFLRHSKRGKSANQTRTQMKPI